MNKFNKNNRRLLHFVFSCTFRVSRCNLYFYFLLLFSGFSIACSEKEQKKEVNHKPNIVLLVADDLGYGDIGCYGGDIDTPNIDKLASNGIKFSSFHTAPMCAPTRAMLLSGNDNHIAGMGGQGLITEEFGFEGRLTNRIITIPSLLKEAGYHTYMAGKWHLGRAAESNPHQKGFEQSFALLEGAGNHYNNQSVLKKGNSHYTENGESIVWKVGNYSTDFYTDKIIEYINLNKKDNQPFFAYVAYTSPHWPLQVDKKYWEKYKGIYNDGYEKLKEQRLNSLKEYGIIPKNAKLPPSHKMVIPWDSLSNNQKKKEARKMELYAGMVDNLDYNIGRLINYLKEIGEYNNTLFVFMSDNGAAHRDFINSDRYKVLGKILQENYNDNYDNMGNPDSYISYGPQWAEAGSSPFRYFKDYATEGGTNTTMIISGPNINRKNNIHHGFTSVLDLAPTFYDVADIEYPNEFKGNKVYPLKGNSLVSFLSGKTDEVHKPDYIFALEHYGNAMLRKGEWKITNYIRPFELENFALYNLSKDIGEQNDLKKAEPEKYEEMLMEWKKFAKEVKLQIPAPSAKK